MKKFLKWFFIILLLLCLTYFVGPKPAKPLFKTTSIDLPASLTELEKEINQNEKTVRGLKPDNEARIIWADTSRKEKTPIAFLYLHGFSASQAEGEPVHRDIAKKYNANLYLSRLAEHGTDLGDSTMINLDAVEYEASARRALQITEQLGEEIIVIGCSTGGALALYLTSLHPEIKALILYSPAVKLYDPTAVILNKPWGLQIARMVTGGKVTSFEPESKEHSNYWQLSYRIEALVALQNLISYTMKPEVFGKITCPVFLGYYYKNEEEQDNTVSVPAMLKMYDQLGTPDKLKEKAAFPEAGVHVISSYIRSKDWQSVESETDKFLSEIVIKFQ